MTDDREPPVRELSPAEIEVLRQEMRESIEWAKTELAHRRALKPPTRNVFGLRNPEGAALERRAVRRSNMCCKSCS
ncbi:hypothetical protein IPC462_02360 [Pseudomonas aeruginosa]|nr:hypothetical protein IPC462_02360 [Pseudomonas aeruginosa]TQR67297.1 hypothetical protein DMY46_11345 [Pseudomonas aeruginosa]